MSMNVLVVDDSSVIRSVIKKALQMSGLDVGHVFEAKNGVEALHLLSRNPVDLVFSDLNMPDMDGRTLALRMSLEPSLQKVPVVIVSADPSVQTSVDDKSFGGIRAYIRKPFRPEDFHRVIEELAVRPGGLERGQ